MSDRGRGVGRGRGGPPRGGGSGSRGGASRGGSEFGDSGGGRGGRGGSRGGSQYGDSGGSQYGDVRGGRGGSRGDFRGDFRGGRGSGRGDFQGGRGDFQGGRGRGGGFRGGRGGASAYSGPEVFGYGSIPQPDAEVTALENKWVQEQNSSLVGLTSQVAKLSVADGYWPFRPGFGSNGNRIILWTNYFKMDLKTPPLWKYDVVASEPKSAETKSEASGNTPPQDGPKGRKLARLIELALEKLDLPAHTVASEYKDKVISLVKLSLPEDAVIKVEYLDNRGRAHDWNMKFNGPHPISVDPLLEYLKTMRDPQDDGSFPKFPEIIDALNVILGHSPRVDKNTAAVGQGRFFATDPDRMDETPRMPPGLLTILRGYFQSVRLATGRILLNVNVTHGIFRRPVELTDLFKQLQLNKMGPQGGPQLSQYFMQLKRLQKHLNKARIICKVPAETGPAEYVLTERTIAGLAYERDGDRRDKEKPPPQFQPGFPYAGPGNVKFLMRKPKTPEGKPEPIPPKGLKWDSPVRVSDYYYAKHGIAADLTMPLINVGSPTRPIYVLAELCRLLPQSVKAKLDPDQQDAMIQFACRPPPANAQSITSSGRELLKLDNNKLLARFGIDVAKQLITVIGRELEPPAVAYLNRNNQLSPVIPSDGGWLMKGIKVVRSGAAIRTWTFLYLSGFRDRDEYGIVKKTVGDFADFMADSGININRQATPASGIRSTTQDRELTAAFKELASLKEKPQLVFVILPDKSTPIYNMVKKLGDVDFGIQTVCVVRQKFLQSKGQLGYFANVFLKVNLKFGGINHKLRDDNNLIRPGKTMMVGYDVTHPTNLGPGMGLNAPSIVGLVASVDRDLGHWPGVAWNNDAGQEELGSELISKFQGRLEMWEKHNNGALPDNIIIFRDGVSEGQFKMVIDREVSYIRRACELKYGGARKPRMTVIVSVKRHQTRFYPTDPGHIHHRSKSPKEGTVVDRGVTNVRYWDFFLQAHASLQGTARPAHYTVLIDEIFRAQYGPNAANALEELTHDMCYLYGRATKAVSICPPAYYADLVCTRARIHKNELFDDAESISSADRIKYLERKVHPSLEDSMYYI
ncbi:Piwi-domain-containing protein [Thozetella sp. PMI_491]|nr:Piwi-domain-containing protein [Thozetella sp. PMI_491]